MKPAIVRIGIVASSLFAELEDYVNDEMYLHLRNEEFWRYHIIYANLNDLIDCFVNKLLDEKN